MTDDLPRTLIDIARAGMAPNPKTDEGIDMDDIDEAIQDAICDDEGRLRAKTLLHHLAKRGWTIARAVAADYPRPVERLGPIVPGRVPADHVHHWVPGVTVGDSRVICRDCGESAKI